MKIKKFKSKQILKLHLLKSRVYEQIIKKKSSNSLNEMDLLQTITSFKKALQVIFQYHNADKRVLFVGVPKKLEFRINKLTKHAAVSNVFNLQGIISNYSKNRTPVSLPGNKTKTSILKSLELKLSRKPDLIVLFSHEKKANLISESYFAKIPLIIFNDDDTHSRNLTDTFYKVPGNENNLMNTSNQNLFSMGLNFLFKVRRKKQNGLKSQRPFLETSNSRTSRKRFV